MPGKTEFVYVQGLLKWVRGHVPNDYGNWKCTVYPTPESLEKIRELQAEGIKNVLKKDEDGYYVSFSRPSQKVIKGKVQGFAPPEILDHEGKPLRDIQVGNGSKGIVKLEVYSHGTPGGGKAKAARWLALKVTDLIPFSPQRDFDETEQRAVKGLDTQQEELF